MIRRENKTCLAGKKSRCGSILQLPRAVMNNNSLFFTPQGSSPVAALLAHLLPPNSLFPDEDRSPPTSSFESLFITSSPQAGTKSHERKSLLWIFGFPLSCYIYIPALFTVILWSQLSKDWTGGGGNYSSFEFTFTRAHPCVLILEGKPPQNGPVCFWMVGTGPSWTVYSRKRPWSNVLIEWQHIATQLLAKCAYIYSIKCARLEPIRVPLLTVLWKLKLNHIRQ